MINFNNLKKICDKYGDIAKNKDGQLSFTDIEIKVFEKLNNCSNTWNRICFGDTSLKQIENEIIKQEKILKEIRGKFPNLLFEFLDNEDYIYNLVYTQKEKTTENYWDFIHKYENDGTIDTIYDIAEKYITEEEYKDFIIIYDFLEEIKK